MFTSQLTLAVLKHKRLVTSLLLISLAQSALALPLIIPDSLQQKIALTVIDAKNNQVIYDYHGSTPMRLASNMKIITSYVALDQLGPDFSWPTKLSYSGKIINNALVGDVYLIGGGDPTLSCQNIQDIVSHLKVLGVNRIEGNLILDSSIFNSIAPNSELHPEPLAEYSVEPNGLLIDSNLSKVTLKSSVGKQAQITISPKKIANYSLQSQLKLNKKSKVGCSDSNDYVQATLLTNKVISLNGTVPASCIGKTVALNLLSNQAYDQRIIRQALQLQHINLAGKIVDGIAASNLTPIYIHNSATLSEILPQMNKFSNNTQAKTLFLSLGAYRSANQNTYLDAKKIYNLLNESQFGFAELHPENGAGLSREERLTTEHMVKLLYTFYQSPNYAKFRLSLPTPNESGTLQTSFREYQGLLYAKTGTLSDSKAYSGYFNANNGHTYILSFIANDITTEGNSSKLCQFKQLLATTLANLNNNESK